MSSNPDVPPFTGYVETTVNALRLIHAARQGVIPRITRRLNDAERRTMIKSGAVFVFSVEESGIKRWTDGLLWSPSRIVGNFLVYREINERTSSRGSHHKKLYPNDDSQARSLARKSSPDQITTGLKNHGPDQGTFKPGGLIKKTITVTIEGSDLHLISYYTSEDIRSGKLKRPSSRPDIMGLYMPPHIFRLTNFRVPPKIEIGPDGKPRLVETEELDPVDCKVEDQGYGMSPWPSPSPSSPIENPNPFGGGGVGGGGGANVYPLGGSQSPGSSNVYARAHQADKWSMNGDSILSASLHRQDMGWSSNSAMSPSPHHSMTRRRGGEQGSSGLHHDPTWPAMQPQSNHHHRWHASPASPETSAASQQVSQGSSAMYQDRNRIRSHPYDDGQMMHRRESDASQHNNSFPLRYAGGGGTAHPNGTREGALQRLHWHSRDLPDGTTTATTTTTRDHRRVASAAQAAQFPHSPTLAAFNPQGYHHHANAAAAAATYTSSWTPNDSAMIPPTLHAIPSAQTALAYDNAYAANVSSASISSQEEFSNVDEYPES